jgi:MFS family permease
MNHKNDTTYNCCCSVLLSLWFASNAVMTDLVINFGLTAAIGSLTSAVQFGFILGTLVFIIGNSGSLFSFQSILSKRNAWSAIQCRSNMEGNSLTTMLSIRFLTGFFLAGIYPVGMKIAADYFNKGLGKSLGF